MGGGKKGSPRDKGKGDGSQEAQKGKKLVPFRKKETEILNRQKKLPKESLRRGPLEGKKKKEGVVWKGEKSPLTNTNRQKGRGPTSFFLGRGGTQKLGGGRGKKKDFPGGKKKVGKESNSFPTMCKGGARKWFPKEALHPKKKAVSDSLAQRLQKGLVGGRKKGTRSRPAFRRKGKEIRTRHPGEKAVPPVRGAAERGGPTEKLSTGGKTNRPGGKGKKKKGAVEAPPSRPTGGGKSSLQKKKKSPARKDAGGKEKKR